MLQRAAAVVLCVCFLAPLCQPLLSPEPNAALPYCCRRNGKHHCAMLARHPALQRPRASEPRFTRALESCPYRAALYARIARRPIASPQSLAFYMETDSHPAISADVEALAHVFQSRHFQRGPPHPTLH